MDYFTACNLIKAGFFGSIMILMIVMFFVGMVAGTGMQRFWDVHRAFKRGFVIINGDKFVLTYSEKVQDALEKVSKIESFNALVNLADAFDMDLKRKPQDDDGS